MIQLRRPHIDLAPSYLDFMNEMKRLGETVWALHMPGANESDLDFVNRILKGETDPPPDLVPESIYWATQGDKVVGKIGLRHKLTDNLREFGGNIGYEVRPSSRRQGIATEMLRLVLETSKARKIGKLLLTCAPNNTGSIKTILANDGVFERSAYVPKWQRETQYYWIDLKK